LRGQDDDGIAFHWNKVGMGTDFAGSGREMGSHEVCRNGWAWA